MLLLLVLQAAWVKSSYDQAFADVRREVNNIFRNAVTAVRDSTFARQVVIMPSEVRDSLASPTGSIFLSSRIDQIAISTDTTNKAGTGRVHAKDAQVSVYLSGAVKKDSLKGLLPVLANRITEGRSSGPSKFMIRINRDTINRDSVLQTYHKLAAGTRYDFPLTVESSHIELPFAQGSMFPRMNNQEPAKDDTEARMQNGSFETSWVQVDPVTRFRANVSGAGTLVWKLITPQILFSIFLTALTGLSFYVMFRSIRSQQRMMILRNDLISNITHELKTPIATVSVALEALRDFHGKNNPEVTREYLEIAKLELDRLTRLTEKVLITSQLDEQQLLLRNERVDLSQITGQVMKTMRPLLEKAGAQTTVEIAESAIVNGDELHLTHVVYNLVENALKYSAGQPWIRVAVSADQQHVLIEVQDHGIGIAPEYLPRIFDKFFRVPSGNVHNTSGHGLGLHYVSRVVTAHNGQVHVQSKPGEGTTFRIELPLLQHE